MNRTERPSGSHCGQRCVFSPFASSSLVSGSAVPPAAGIRRSPEKTAGANTMVPSFPHVGAAAALDRGEGDRRASRDRDLLELARRHEAEPLAVGREERVVGPRGGHPAREDGLLETVEGAEHQPLRLAFLAGRVDDRPAVGRGDEAGAQSREDAVLGEVDLEPAHGLGRSGRRPRSVAPARGRAPRRRGPPPTGATGAAPGATAAARGSGSLRVLEPLLKRHPRVADVAQPPSRVLLQAAAAAGPARRRALRGQSGEVGLLREDAPRACPRSSLRRTRASRTASRRARSRRTRCRRACRPPCRAPAPGSCRQPSRGSRRPRSRRGDRGRERGIDAADRPEAVTPRALARPKSSTFTRPSASP